MLDRHGLASEFIGVTSAKLEPAPARSFGARVCVGVTAAKLEQAPARSFIFTFRVLA